MGKELEAPIEKAVVKWAKQHRWLTLKINVQGTKGWPDHFFFGKPKLLVMMEFKRPGRTKVDKLQAYVHGLLRTVGWPVYVVNNVEEGIGILKEERTRALATEAVPGTGDRDDDGAGGGRPIP